MVTSVRVWFEYEIIIQLKFVNDVFTNIGFYVVVFNEWEELNMITYYRDHINRLLFLKKLCQRWRSLPSPIEVKESFTAFAFILSKLLFRV